MLFTNTFLKGRVKPDTGIARKLIEVFTQVYVLWNNAQNNGEEWTEAQTEKRFVQPVLEILGWSFAVQVKIRDIGDVTRPDYTLFMDAMSRGLGELKGEESTDLYNQALAVAEAKHWNRSLDVRGEIAKDSWKANANPDHQMIGYLKATGVSWGVLTNGSVWRIYHQSVSSTATDFFDINLSDIFKGVDPKHSPGADRLERFFIWWQVFHRNAFVPDGAGLALIDRLLDDYVRYKNEVKERLINRITDQAIPAIAEGILLHRYRKYGKDPAAKIDATKLASTASILIYRMLFLFVAEHNGLLPADVHGNQVIGLCTLANSVLDARSGVQNIYDALIKLFQTVYFGDKERHVPPYRGELYNPSSPDFKFLMEHILPDALIRRVFKALTIDGAAAVDFECFDSLLLADVGEVLLDASIYFAELPLGRRELKAMVNRVESPELKGVHGVKLNSPPVNYLIHQALKNVMDERRAKYNAAMGDIVTIRMAQINETQTQSPDASYQQLLTANNNAMEAMLGVRVLDPCMNTGICLISVIEYLTKDSICSMQAYHDLHPEVPWDWNPIYVLLDQERKRSLARLSRYGLEVKSGEFGDTRLLKRIITLKCIYGVEANPTTVAIAKHNIWLATLSVGAPFSFLDHHLRRGNALMGTLVRDDFGPDCQPIQDYLAEGVIKALKKLPDTKSQLVTGRWNARQYEVFHNAIEPYHVMLDLSILTSLGHSATRELINRYSSDTGAVYLDPKTKNLTAGIDFFHWDLEFPEIFLEEIKGAVNKDAGFHAVISMPISRLSMNDIKHSEKYLTTHFPTVESLKNTNWYRFAQGLRLLTDSGYLAMVIDQRAFITKSDPLEKVLKRLIDSNN